MANDLTVQRAGQLPARTEADRARAKKRAAEITQGISQPFARVTYKQGNWGVRSQGIDRMLDYIDDRGERRKEENLDCVLLDVAERTAKVFYLESYDPKKRDAPDCASSNGIRPDPGIAYHPDGKDKGGKQAESCAQCKWNQWGSRRASENRPASRGKECGDYKKIALVPFRDIENKRDGGPMLLGVPPSSLKAYKTYIDKLAEVGFEPDEVWTRITFVEGMDYPLMDFDCPGILTADQKALSAKVVAEHKTLIERILNAGMDAAEGWDEPPPLTGDGKPAATNGQATNGAAQEEPEPEPEVPADPPPPAGVSADEWAVILKNRRAAEPPPPKVVEPPPPPPGVSPEEWALILKARQAVALPPEPAVKKPAAKRTKVVSPEPHDSAAEAAKSAGASPPRSPAPPTGNGGGADPEVTAKIAAMVDKLV